MSAGVLRSLLILLASGALASACGGARGRYNPDLLSSMGGFQGSAEVPQECGPGAGFGSVGAGTRVVLRTHRSVDGDRNWIAPMTQYVGHATRVTGRAGRDPNDCPVVRVSIDGGRHFWRVRDLTIPGRGLGPGGGEAVPQACDQSEDAVDYGLAQPGAEVVVWRHRRVEGDANWTEEMSSHVGDQTRVTRLAGVDAQGCPVLHVQSDGGEWVWRARDLALVEAALPQQCDRGADPAFGPLQVGTTVRLGRHRPVGGETNWRQTMEQYVDRQARITSLGPADDQGCPVVHVDVDQGARSWRVRDLAILDAVRGAATVPTAGPPGGGGSTGGIPQACGQPFGREDYGPIREGSEIILGRHRPVGGDDNWAEEMGAFVGRRARVTRLSGSDGAGCPGIRVDIDSGEWFWRIRDARLP